MVARRLCAYTAIDAAAVPAPRRRAFVETALARWTPFADSVRHVEWAGDRAMVWAWSEARVLEVEGTRLPRPRRILPEPLLRGGALHEGAALVAMDEGVEGRVWVTDMLIASTWWPTAPALGEWNLFLRGAGQPAQSRVPMVEPAPLSDQPWSRPQRRGLGESVLRHRTAWRAAVVGIAALLVAGPLASAARLHLQAVQVERRIAGQGEGLQRILAAREGAERDAAAIDALVELRPPASQIQLLATVVQVMPAGSWELLEWRMPDPGRLEVDIRMSNPDPQALVSAWEKSGLFNDVSAELARASDEIGVRARIVGARTPGEGRNAADAATPVATGGAAP